METLLAALIAIAAVVLAAFGIGRAKGKQAGAKEAVGERQKAQAAQRQAAGERVKAEAAQQRQEVQREVEQLPAESGDGVRSAADRLRDEWSRD